MFSLLRVNFRKVFALIVKEFYQIIRDPSTILIAGAFPIILLFIYGVGVSLDMNNLKIGLILQDNSSSAQSFALSLKDSKYFSVETITSEHDLNKKLVGGKMRGLVIVPFYFSQYSERKTQEGPIYVIGDGSEPNTASFVQNYVQGAWLNWQMQEAISNGGKKAPKINVQPRFWYNEELNSHHFLIPGSIAIIMTLIGTLLTSLVITREWERGTFEALMSTPVTMKEIYLAKLFSYFCLGMGSMAMCTFIAIIIYGVPFRGTFLALTMVSSIFLITNLAMGLLISSITRSQFVASQISIVLAFLPGFMLSGFVFENSSMPFVINMISYLFPARYMVSSLQTLFLAGSIWRLLFFNSVAMIIIALILFLIISRKTVKRLD
jgi:ABC-2 type transport system permease protein